MNNRLHFGHLYIIIDQSYCALLYYLHQYIMYNVYNCFYVLSIATQIHGIKLNYTLEEKCIYSKDNGRKMILSGIIMLGIKRLYNPYVV